MTRLPTSSKAARAQKSAAPQPAGSASTSGPASTSGASGGRKKSQQALDDYLSSLFPMRSGPAAKESQDTSAAADSDRVADEDAVWIERERIEPNPAQPRRTWSEASLRELGESLGRDGQLQPCVVRPHPDKPGFYQLVSGERRWRASAPEYGNVPRLRCTVRSAGDDESFRLALVENLQREDLNDIDKAQAFVLLRGSLQQSDPRVTWSQVSSAVGLSREYLQRLRALLDLPGEVQEMVRGGQVSARSARALTALKDAALQIQLAHEIHDRKLSSDQVAERVRALASSPSGASPKDGAVTRESRDSKEAGGWEEALREAVRLLEQAQAGAPRGKKAGKRARRLVGEARGHLDALALAVEGE